MNKLGLYVHIPFCLSKCPYCDFYSVKYDEDTAKRYIKAVQTNILGCGGVKFDTVYFGGGTPILLWREICGLLDNIGDMIDHGAEISLEANPCVTSAEAAAALLSCGVNRISLGLQSMSDTELIALGRRHNAKQGAKAVEICRDAGFSDISADIMIGTPCQTRESLRHTLSIVTSLPVTHISAYMLKIEPDTPFAKRELSLPSEDGYADMYLDTVEELKAKGFFQYEISNFALKGHECRHNLKYWRCEEYIGVGPAAHSFYGGKRYAVKRDIGEFLDNVPQRTYITDDCPAGFDERVMLGLRISEGIDLYALCDRFGIPQKKADERLRQIPPTLYSFDGNRLKLTPEGFLVSNAVIGIMTDIK